NLLMSAYATPPRFQQIVQERIVACSGSEWYDTTGTFSHRHSQIPALDQQYSFQSLRLHPLFQQVVWTAPSLHNRYPSSAPFQTRLPATVKATVRQIHLE